MAGIKKWLRYLSYPISFRRRDWAVYRQLANNDNGIPSATLLKIELGDKALEDIGGGAGEHLAQPVNVLGIYKNPHMKYLHINPLFNTLLSLGTVAFTRSTPRDKYQARKMNDEVAAKDYRTIYMNRAFLFNPLTQVAYLSWFHSLATGAAGLAVAGGRAVFKALGAHYLTTAAAASIGASSARSSWTRLLSMPFASYADVAGHEHIHFLQKEDRDSKRSGFNALGGEFRKKAIAAVRAHHPVLQKADACASLGFVRYFLGDHEIQARLHTVLAHGVRRWGRLPRNRDELWQALDSSGFTPPDEIRRDMRESFNAASAFNRDASAGAKLARLGHRIFSPDIAELRIAQNALLDPGLKAEFWRETLPYLYGHLLELYGCKTGRAEMGFKDVIPAKAGIAQAEGLHL